MSIWSHTPTQMATDAQLARTLSIRRQNSIRGGWKG